MDDDDYDDDDDEQCIWYENDSKLLFSCIQLDMLKSREC